MSVSRMNIKERGCTSKSGVRRRGWVVSDLELRRKDERGVGEESIPAPLWHRAKDQHIPLLLNGHGVGVQAHLDRDANRLVGTVAKDFCRCDCHESSPTLW